MMVVVREEKRLPPMVTGSDPRKGGGHLKAIRNLESHFCPDNNVERKSGEVFCCRIINNWIVEILELKMIGFAIAVAFTILDVRKEEDLILIPLLVAKSVHLRPTSLIIKNTKQ